jgi:hypothetical protein
MGCRGTGCRMLKRLFKLKREEITGGWRKVPKQELHDLYS